MAIQNVFFQGGFLKIDYRKAYRYTNLISHVAA